MVHGLLEFPSFPVKMSTNPPRLQSQDFAESSLYPREKPISTFFRIKERGTYDTDVRHLSLFQREAAEVLRRERARAAAQGGRTKGQARRQLTPRAPPLQVCLLLTYRYVQIV